MSLKRPLTEQGKAILNDVFALQDTFTSTEIQAIASKAATTVPEVRNYASKFKYTVRQTIEECTSNSPAFHGVRDGELIMDKAGREQIAIQRVELITNLRQNFILELDSFLDSNGGVSDAAAATAVTQLAVAAVHWFQRKEILKAMLATQSFAARTAFLNMRHLVAVLNNWIFMADEDARWTELELTLKALTVLELHKLCTPKQMKFIYDIKQRGTPATRDAAEKLLMSVLPQPARPLQPTLQHPAASASDTAVHNWPPADAQGSGGQR